MGIKPEVVDNHFTTKFNEGAWRVLESATILIICINVHLHEMTFHWLVLS